jgi:uncharacterized membrane protein
MPVLILAYPLLVHLAVVLQQPLLQWLALCCLVAVPLYTGLRGGSGRSWLLYLLLVIALFLLTRAGGGRYALFLPPVVLPLIGAWFFGRSLQSGQAPLISKIARASRGGKLPAELVSYTRGVTWLWTLTLTGMSLLSLLLATFAPLELWSLFTNFLNYIVLGALFPLEYLWHRFRFRHLEHPGFIGHIRNVATFDYRKL